MAFEPKQWKYDDDVTEQELNRIEQGIVEANQKADQNASALAAHLNETVQQGVHGLTTTSDLTFYVDALNGRDENDGLTPATAFQTIKKAVDSLPPIIRHTVTIQLADGIYNERVLISGFYGQVIEVRGNDTNPTNVKVSSFHLLRNSCDITFFNLEIIGADYNAIQIDNNGFLIQLYNIKIQTTSNFDGIVTAASNVRVENCTISNRQSAIICYNNSKVFSKNNTGSGNNTGLSALEGSTIAKEGSQPSGIVAEYAGAGGVIR